MKLDAMRFDPGSAGVFADHVSVELFVLTVGVGF